MTAIVDMEVPDFMKDPVFSQSPLPSLLQMKIDYLHKFAAEWECDNVILNLVLHVTNKSIIRSSLNCISDDSHRIVQP